MGAWSSEPDRPKQALTSQVEDGVSDSGSAPTISILLADQGYSEI